MELRIRKEKGVTLQQDMMGLFFEDINYAADGGLYAEMLENRSFEFLDAYGDVRDYYIVYDGHYGWTAYPDGEVVKTRMVMGSPLTEENPHYMRIHALTECVGICNRAFGGIYLKKGMDYRIRFWARCVKFDGEFLLQVIDNSRICIQENVDAGDYKEETYNGYRYYETTITTTEDVENAKFVFALSDAGTVEVDFISMMPTDAVEGVFRRDLYEKLEELKPGFIRFPGGCVVEGNTLHNRYRFKDSLKPEWARRNNWNRWAVHGNDVENRWHSIYSHYNQTLGLGYYEYFLLCEKLGAKAIPVINVGIACQYQSQEVLPMDDPAWQELVQDALDLIEFANGDENTPWGKVRVQMGHKEPFNLTMLAIGNEQWQTEKVDYYERYAKLEEAIHARDPQIQLIGSAGPDITSKRYGAAWKFYQEHKEQDGFVYAVDEHFYVKPQWLLEHVDFYDGYDRGIKVFAGEYAAHTVSGMNMPKANTLEGALAEAAFLTGVERNGDVVVKASYAPLFARLGYAQWSPDMIWFDEKSCYGSPSYYVQKMYGNAVGDYTLAAGEDYKEAWKDKLYYSLSYKEESGEIIIKIANADTQKKLLKLMPDESWSNISESYTMEILTGSHPEDFNSILEPEKVAPYVVEGNGKEDIMLPPLSFSVIRLKAGL